MTRMVSKEKTTKIKVISYNIHKGFGWFRLRYQLDRMRKLLMQNQADVIFLQEVTGHWPIKSPSILTPLEHLAHQVWPHQVYGKNAVYKKGDHGNAILSRYPIIEDKNLDLTLHKWEKRGLLWAHLNVDGLALHVGCVHLNLRHTDREAQVHKICQELSFIDEHEPLILAGDFNDWNQKLSHTLERELNLLEVHKIKNGAYKKTFPSFFPLLKMDRIYFRNLNVHDVDSLHLWDWHWLSDHKPVSAIFEHSSSRESVKKY